MASKSTDWRPGPTVCRCCLSEGCYKDISTEYFWMGKREVYSEMLLESFNLSIAYSQSGGPNSNSRLICEPCISRLRDATEFKRQVQECEKTFMQYLDPGSSAINEMDAPLDNLDSQVKVEEVKLEKQLSDDDFDDQPDFGDDDDDDDLDDQPLTKFATKVPKKESVDLLDLLDNAKATEKRKSSSKTKSTPAKKAKMKKDTVKATSSKAIKPEKKKKGLEEDTRTIGPEPSIKITWKKKRRVAGDKANAALILQHSNAVAFRCQRGKFMCAYCQTNCANIKELREHSNIHNKLDVLESPEIRCSFPLRIDITDLTCTICEKASKDLEDLKDHLNKAHSKIIDAEFKDGVIPFILTGPNFKCVHCTETFERLLSLFIHMNVHYQSFVCQTCGKGFYSKHKLRAHQTCHETGEFKCSKCDLVFANRASKNRHANGHAHKQRYRCPVCEDHFDNYYSRLRHLALTHGQKVEYKCSLCPSVFGSSTLRYSHMSCVHLKKRRKRVSKN